MELFIEIDHAKNSSVVTYRMNKDAAKSTIVTDNFGELVDLLGEAAKLISPVAEG